MTRARPDQMVELIHQQAIEYIGASPDYFDGSTSSVLSLAAFIRDDDQPMETLAAIADGCLALYSRTLCEAHGREGALEYVRGILLHNELSRIERGAP